MQDQIPEVEKEERETNDHLRKYNRKRYIYISFISSEESEQDVSRKLLCYSV